MTTMQGDSETNDVRCNDGPYAIGRWSRIAWQEAQARAAAIDPLINGKRAKILRLKVERLAQ
jgi:hypothetical protein